jgi:MSHA pilin protein MshC
MLRERHIKIPPKETDRGFTFFEVLLVLLIVSILSVVVISRNSDSASKAQLRVQADLLKAQLRYAQALSMSGDQIWGMSASGNNLVLFNGGSITNSIRLPGEVTKPVVYGADDLSRLSVSDFLLSFDDRGRPCSGDSGTTLLATTLRVTVSESRSGVSAYIDVTPNTGFIE